MAGKASRREYTEEFKQGLVAELAAARANGVTRSSVVKAAGISDSLSRLWETKYGDMVSAAPRKAKSNNHVAQHAAQVTPLEDGDFVLSYHAETGGFREERFEDEQDALKAYVKAWATGTVAPKMFRVTSVEVDFQASFKAKAQPSETKPTQKLTVVPADAEEEQEKVEEDGQVEAKEVEQEEEPRQQQPSVRVRKRKG